LFDALGLVLGIGAVLTVLYYWDPTRVVVKGLGAKAEAQYQKIPAEMAALPVADWLAVRSPGAAEQRRTQLIERIFGDPDLPRGMMPQRVIPDVEKTTGPVQDCLSPTGPDVVHLLSRMDTIIMRGIGCEAAFYRDWANLAGIDELTGYMAKNWRAYSIGYFRPKQGNGRLILLQMGLAATYHDQHRLIENWVKAGYTVAALNMPGYGDNTCYDTPRYCSGPLMDARYATDLAYAFLPPVIAVNHALSQGEFDRIAMVGLSSGAWITLVSAAIDPRIDLSVPVSGVMPLPMLQGKEHSAEEIVDGLIDIAGVFDMAVMAADRPGRRQMQIFNRFDRCCFHGSRPELFAGLLEETAPRLGGRLDVLFDETHARHKISRWALARIMAAIETADAKAGR
jgi:pimeloyl-ACP methyl ester carboxylesterase